MVLEVNYSPDAGEILKSCPQFYHHVFDVLYGGDAAPGEHFEQLGSLPNDHGGKTSTKNNELPPNLASLISGINI